MEIFKSESLYGSNELTQLDVHRLQNDAVSLQSLQLPSCKSALKQVNDLSRRPAMNFASNEVENLHKTSPIPFDPHNLQSLKLSQISIPDSASHPAVQSSNGILTNQLNNNPLTSSGTTRPGKRPAPESPTNMPDSKFGDELSNSASDGEGQDNSSTTDVEGVWSMDIEQCFQEALAIYPPCGRRKIILSEEGKMYGRNELIARYIYQHTGKIRSRKQVSSHIQVLARRRSKELQAQIKDPDTKQRAIIQLSRLSSAQIVSAGVLGSKPLTGPLTSNSPNVAKSSTPGSATPPEPAKLARSGVNGGVMDFRTAATKGGTERLSTYTNSPHIPSTQTHIPLEQLLHRTNGFSDTMDTQHKFKSKNGLNNTALMASKVAGYSEALALGSGISVGLSSAPVTAMAMAAAQVAAAYGRQVTTEAMCGSLWHNPNILVPPNLSLTSSGSLTRSLDENIPNHIKNVSMHQGLDKVAASPEFIQQNFELANQRHGRMNTTDFPYASLQTANPHLVSNQELPRAKEPKLNDELAYAPMKQKSNQLQPQLINLSDVDPNSLLQRSYPSESMTRFIPDNIEQPWNEGSITAPKMRLVDLSAYILSTTKDGANLPVDQSTQHVFVHIVPSKTPSYAENLLEQVDASQIWDKFPEDSLKELMEKGPADTFFLVKFWADVNVQVDSDCTFAVSAVFEGVEDIPLNLSTKVCSFGKQVVEKIEQVEHPRAENGRFVYRFIRSPMCDYMKSFIGKLLQLRRRDMMNSVLENFTILHILRNNATNELLLCIAYVLEVAQENCGSQHHIYKLTRC